MQVGAMIRRASSQRMLWIVFAQCRCLSKFVCRNSTVTRRRPCCYRQHCTTRQCGLVSTTVEASLFPVIVRTIHPPWGRGVSNRRIVPPRGIIRKRFVGNGTEPSQVLDPHVRQELDRSGNTTHNRQKDNARYELTRWTRANACTVCKR